MNKEQTKILQTAIFLLDNNMDSILENNLLPYVEKAKEIKKKLILE